MEVLSGGIADPTTIGSGGTEVVSAGGTESGTLISGGTQLVYGTADNVTVFAGEQVIEAGGTGGGSVAVTLSGGREIVASGALVLATHTGIMVSGLAAYSGGLVNSGTISGSDIGIAVVNTTRFLGGIRNSGTISGDDGIAVESGGLFSGGIVNAPRGTIDSTSVAIEIGEGGTFLGGVVNSGMLSAGFAGIFAGAVARAA